MSEPLTTGDAETVRERINAAFDQVMEERENRNVSPETADRLLNQIIAVRSALDARSPSTGDDRLREALAKLPCNYSGDWISRCKAKACEDSGCDVEARLVLALAATPAPKPEEPR